MARGNFKQKRGGGRSFSKNLVLNENGTAVSVDRWAARDKKGEDDDSDDDDEEEEESSEEEESEEEEGAATSKLPELTRTQRKEMKKSKKQQATKNEGEDSDEDQDPLAANPNRTAGKKMNLADLNAPRELSRREKDEKAAKEAKERYWKLHEQGKTDQAKADLARLAKIKAEREAAQARRKAEAEAKAAEIETKRQAQMAKSKRA